MASRDPCPTDQHLDLALRGKLPLADLEEVAAHLEHCGTCTTTLLQLRSADTLAEALGNSSEFDQTTLGPQLSHMLTRLKHLPLELAHETHTEPSSAASPERFDFLAPPQSPEELGRLGNYRVLHILGRGGMGLVFEAEDLRIARRVALKVLQARLSNVPAARQRLLREARAVAALEHDHIVPLYEAGEVSGISYLAMPLLRGSTLAARLAAHGPLTAEQVIALARQAASALQFAHDRGVVHRDLKPANVWLDESEGDVLGRVRLLDFGLARIAGQTDAALTDSNLVIGTPAYMAPEQVRGRTVDARADLFSLGAVLYEAAAGQRPFRGTDLLTVLSSLAIDEPQPLHVLRPEFPIALSQMVDRLLRKDPDERPQNAGQVLQQLNDITAAEYLYSPITSRAKSSRRSQLKLAFACVVACISLAALLAFQFANFEDNEAAAEADANQHLAKVVVQQGGEFSRHGDEQNMFSANDPLPSTQNGLYWIRIPSPDRPGIEALIDASRNLSRSPTVLHIGGAAFTDKDLERLAKSPGLRDLEDLDLQSPALTSECLDAVSNWRRLRYLALTNATVNDAWLPAIGKMPSLIGISLPGAQLSDEGLKALRGRPWEMLSFYDCHNITRRGLENLGDLPGLRDLNLFGTGIRDDDLDLLLEYPALHVLWLGKTSVTAEAISRLSQHAELRTLIVTEMPWNDSAEAHLAVLKQLTRLDIRGSGLPPQAVQRLRAALPKCAIHAD